MNIAVMVLFGVLLAFLLVKYGPVSRKKDAEGNDGMHRGRVGDGLRRLNANKKKYSVMTEALLAETADDDLIEAVLSNLWAKMKPDLSDALTVMPLQSLARQRIFALYAITGGVKQVGFEKIKACPDAALLPIALDALNALDMPQSAVLMRDALDTEDADQYQESYSDTFDGEGGKARMIAYIRENPVGFVD